MHPPFDIARLRWKGLIPILVLVAFFAAFSFKLDRIDCALKSVAPGNGIISLELAGVPEAGAIRGRWYDAHVESAAFQSLAYDVGFIVVYSSLFALLCSLAYAGLALRFPSWAQIGAILAWCAFLAGVSDLLEDAALYGVLSFANEPLADMARLFAISKFALVGAILAYLVATGVVGLVLMGRALFTRRAASPPVVPTPAPPKTPTQFDAPDKSYRDAVAAAARGALSQCATDPHWGARLPGNRRLRCLARSLVARLARLCNGLVAQVRRRASG